MLLAQPPDRSLPQPCPHSKQMHVPLCVHLAKVVLTIPVSAQVFSMSPIAFLVKSMCLFLGIIKVLHDWYQPSSLTSPLCKWNAHLVPNKPLH